MQMNSWRTGSSVDFLTKFVYFIAEACDNAGLEMISKEKESRDVTLQVLQVMLKEESILYIEVKHLSNTSFLSCY